MLRKQIQLSRLRPMQDTQQKAGWAATLCRTATIRLPWQMLFPCAPHTPMLATSKLSCQCHRDTAGWLPKTTAQCAIASGVHLPTWPSSRATHGQQPVPQDSAPSGQMARTADKWHRGSRQVLTTIWHLLFLFLVTTLRAGTTKLQSTLGGFPCRVLATVRSVYLHSSICLFGDT